MPRNLPWKVPAARSTDASPSPTPKRRKESSGLGVSNGGDVSRSLAQSDDCTKHHTASPPPDVLSEQFMTSGIEHDDAYIMVEDEFLATARTFTAPLHHAEYKRQKALARARKQAASTSSPDIGTNSAMSAALRHQKTAARNLARGRAALKAVGALNANDNESDSNSSDLGALYGEDDEGPDFDNRNSPPRADDPWLGTSLAPLLSPRKRRAETHLAAPPSLLGLHGVRSDTRAARGFGASEEAGRQPHVTRKYELPSVRASTSAAVPSSASETESDSDDLDGPIKAQQTVKKVNESGQRKVETPGNVDGLTLPSSRVVASPGKREVITSPGGSLPKTRQRPWLTNRGKGATESKGGKGVDVKEIPTFLV